jgi:hypothetical protein
VEIQQAVTFIEEHGSSLEKARMGCIVHGMTPQAEEIHDFLGLQNDDGGFPYQLAHGNLSTLNETTVALWWLEDLDLLHSPTTQGAFEYLLSVQSTDGSWDEDPRIAQYDLPPWIQVGDRKTQLYLSANASYWLAIGGYMRNPALRKAIHFLIRNQEASGRFYGYLHTTWIAAATLLMAGERYDQVARRAIQALSGQSVSSWADSQIAWALDCLSRAGLPGDHPFAKGCINELLRRQKPDGSWASEDGEGSAVSASIQVLKVFKRYGLLSYQVGDQGLGS